LKFIINITLLLVSTMVSAQKLDTLLKPKPSYLPTGIRVGIDAISMVRTFTDNSFKGQEINGDIDFNRYFLAVELGQWERELSTDQNQYDNKGAYFRIGADVNFLKKDPEKNMLFAGARYGHGRFSENLTITSVDPVWGTQTDSYSNNNVNANWIELTTGLKVRMFGIFWMGYTARYKFALSTDEPRGFIPHDVPGYGKTYKDNTWGFNYYIMFRIPVRKDKQTLLKALQENK
jgi:hypothetical protein